MSQRERVQDGSKGRQRRHLMAAFAKSARDARVFDVLQDEDEWHDATYARVRRQVRMEEEELDREYVEYLMRGN